MDSKTQFHRADFMALLNAEEKEIDRKREAEHGASLEQESRQIRKDRLRAIRETTARLKAEGAHINRWVVAEIVSDIRMHARFGYAAEI